MTTDTVQLSVADAYDRWARLYDNYDNPMLFAAGRAVATLTESIWGAAVLEFGCGTGRNLALLKAAGAGQLVGLDMSEGMLREAERRDLGLQLHQQDMAAPAPTPDSAFDLVLFCLTLEHVADMAIPLKEARRVLRTGGRICVIEIHPFLALEGVSANFEDEGTTVRMPTVTHTFADYVSAANQAGLVIETCRGWRARDLGTDAPAKVRKRGLDALWILQLELRPSSPAAA